MHTSRLERSDHSIVMRHIIGQQIRAQNQHTDTGTSDFVLKARQCSKFGGHARLERRMIKTNFWILDGVLDLQATS